MKTVLLECNHSRRESQFNNFSKYRQVFKIGNPIFTGFTWGLSEEFCQLIDWSVTSKKGTVKSDFPFMDDLCVNSYFSHFRTTDWRWIWTTSFCVCWLNKYNNSRDKHSTKLTLLSVFLPSFFWLYNEIDKRLLIVVQKTRQKHQEIHALENENHCQPSRDIVFSTLCVHVAARKQKLSYCNLFCTLGLWKTKLA